MEIIVLFSFVSPSFSFYLIIPLVIIRHILFEIALPTNLHSNCIIKTSTSNSENVVNEEISFLCCY